MTERKLLRAAPVRPAGVRLDGERGLAVFRVREGRVEVRSDGDALAAARLEPRESHRVGPGQLAAVDHLHTRRRPLSCLVGAERLVSK